MTLAERPDLEQAQRALTAVWPEFMLWDPIASLYYAHLDRWAEFALLAVDGDTVAARGFSVPFAMGAGLERTVLAPDGWDRVVQWAHRDHVTGRKAITVAGLEIALLPRYRGSGLATEMVVAMKENADRLGFGELVIPVRPRRKHLEPATSMVEYAARTREDGFPEDSWLRTYVRAGRRIQGVCPTSLTITGTLGQWREWTGLPFDTSGDVLVEGALVPMDVSVPEDHAVYVEPNVWVRHSWGGDLSSLAQAANARSRISFGLVATRCAGPGGRDPDGCSYHFGRCELRGALYARSFSAAAAVLTLYRCRLAGLTGIDEYRYAVVSVVVDIRWSRR